MQDFLPSDSRKCGGCSFKGALRILEMSWAVKTTCFKAPGVLLGGSGVSIGGVRIPRAGDFSKIVEFLIFPETCGRFDKNLDAVFVDWGETTNYSFLFGKSFTRWWFQLIYIFSPTWGDDQSDQFFQMGWNHQLQSIFLKKDALHICIILECPPTPR